MDNKFFKNFNIEEIKRGAVDFLKGIPWFLGRRAFWVVILFVLVDVALGIVIYYNYIYVPREIQGQPTEIISIFEYDSYREVLAEWQKRDNIIDSSTEVLPTEF